MNIDDWSALVIFVQQSKINKFCINSTVFHNVRRSKCCKIIILAMLFIDEKNQGPRKKTRVDT